MAEIIPAETSIISGRKASFSLLLPRNYVTLLQIHMLGYSSLINRKIREWNDSSFLTSDARCSIVKSSGPWPKRLGKGFCSSLQQSKSTFGIKKKNLWLLLLKRLIGISEMYPCIWDLFLLRKSVSTAPWWISGHSSHMKIFSFKNSWKNPKPDSYKEYMESYENITPNAIVSVHIFSKISIY